MKHLKVADEPSIDGIAENRTDLYLLFPNHIQVEREEKAYTFLSLVADCGGSGNGFIKCDFDPPKLDFLYYDIILQLPG